MSTTSARHEPASDHDRLPKVLLVASAFRSGSTIIDNILGQVDGFCSVGELRSLWEKGVVGGTLCGCGVPVTRCEFWQAVRERAFPGGEPEGRAVVELQRRHVRTRPRQLLGIWRGARRGSPSRPVGRYVDLIQQLYAGIAATSGARVVVDSSKVPADAYALAAFTELDLYVLHLVRDPRAVAYSWSRKKASPDDPSLEYMQQWSSLTSSAQWIVWNSVIEGLLRPRSPRYLLLRYEDFAARPVEAIRSICDFVGEPSQDLPFVDEHTVRLGQNHGVAGNPGRLLTGDVAIRVDEEWRTRMSTASRLLSSLPALPLAARYGYRSLEVARRS